MSWMLLRKISAELQKLVLKVAVSKVIALVAGSFWISVALWCIFFLKRCETSTTLKNYAPGAGSFLEVADFLDEE